MSGKGNKGTTNVIILNRMYVGDYLGKNIGHEIINLIKDDNKDNKNNYIYVNHDGRVNENFYNKKWKATTILLTRWCPREYKEKDTCKIKTLSMVEVLAKATGLEPCFSSEDINEAKKIYDKYAPKRYIDKLKKDYKKGISKDWKEKIERTLNKLEAKEKKSKEWISKIRERLEYQSNPKGNGKSLDKDIIDKFKKNLQQYREDIYWKILHRKQRKYAKEIKYGGQNLEKIFGKNVRNDRAIYISFKGKVQKVKKGQTVYLVDEEFDEKIINYDKKKEKIININKDNKEEQCKYTLNFAKASLKQYITEGIYSKKANKIVNYEEIYKKLQEIINNKNVWEKNEESIKTYDNLTDEIKTDEKKPNFLEIINQEYNELIYSNLFYYIFKSDPKLFYDFAKDCLKIGKHLSEDGNGIEVFREEGNIDLLIEDKDKKTLIVIENKIKSGINGVRHDETGDEVGNQLSKYIHYAYGFRVEKGTDKKGYTYKKFKDDEKELKDYEDYNKRLFYIFAPNYKNFNITEINEKIVKILNQEESKLKNKYKKEDLKEEPYKLITYGDIYKFFKEYKFDETQPKPKYFDEFLFAIERHSHDVDNIQELQMYERFIERINELKESGK